MLQGMPRNRFIRSHLTRDAIVLNSQDVATEKLSDKMREMIDVQPLTDELLSDYLGNASHPGMLIEGKGEILRSLRLSKAAHHALKLWAPPVPFARLHNTTHDKYYVVRHVPCTFFMQS